MRINVAQQLKGHIGESRSITINETSSDGFPIEGKAILVLTNRSILVTGSFKTSIKCVCSRCLEEFEQSYIMELEEEFFPENGFLRDGMMREDNSIEGFSIGEDNVLDLNEAFRQNTLVNVPQKPVCHQDCAGLCPKCGCNLNVQTCDCSRQQTDPRWAPLHNLISDQN